MPSSQPEIAAGLLPAELLEAPLGGLGAALLESGATAVELLADLLDVGPGVPPPVRKVSWH